MKNGDLEYKSFNDDTCSIFFRSDYIEYREKNGNFKSIEDIKNVNGIGNKTFEKIKEYIKL